MKKRNFLIFILIILISLTSIFIFFLLSQNTKEEENNQNKDLTPLTENKNFNQQPLIIDHCKNKDDEKCNYSNNTLRYIHLNQSYQELDTIIDTINKTIKEKYEQSINSTSELEADECKEAKDIYKYRNLYSMTETLYQSKDLIGIFYDISGIDVCTKKALPATFNSYVYDITKNTILTNQEILELYHQTPETVNKTIQNTIKDWNKTLATDYNENDFDKEYKLYIASNGDLDVVYLNTKNNITYSAQVKKLTNN